MSTLPQPSLGPTLSQRTTPSVSPLEATMIAISRQLHVGLPGIILSFDPNTITATVQLAIREHTLVADTPTNVTSAVLQDVPVILPHGNGFSLTLPLGNGAECMVHFSDLCINSWWQSGGVQNAGSQRRHSLSDAFAVPGPWSQPNVLSNYSTTAMELRSDDGTVKISLAADQITVTAPTVNVNGTDAINLAVGSSLIAIDSSGITINGDSNTSIDGKPFLPHEHLGVESGGGTSGPVA